MIGDLLLACLVTVVVETAVFWLAGYRSRDEILVVVCTNVVTNLVLNLILSGLFFSVTGYMMRIGGGIRAVRQGARADHGGKYAERVYRYGAVYGRRQGNDFE